MKLTGKYQPSVGMEIEDRIYEPASLIMNDLYSNLFWLLICGKVIR